MQQGLSHQQAQALLKEWGSNVLPQKKKYSQIEIFIRQFKSPLIYILILAAIVTALLHEFTDTVVILAAVAVNSMLGFYQESKAEKSLLALANMLNHTTHVMRDGAVRQIGVEELVPGDVVILGTGDKIPADGVLLETVSMTCNEAMLTGESMPVRKKTYTGSENPLDGESIDESHKVYMGTIVLAGRGVCIVTATGERARMGQIASSLASVTQDKTPLQNRLEKLANFLAIVISVASVGVFATGVMLGNSYAEMFTTSVAIAVAAIPEGMVITLTVILAIGMQRILKRNALARRLLAVEVLGAVTTIATDKTGTLTEGVMLVSKVDVEDLELACQTAILANNLDDPLEMALREWSEREGHDPQKISEGAIREKETPFDSKRKYMSVTVEGVTYVKGAPEVVLEMCKHNQQQKKEILAKLARWSDRGLRVIGLAAGPEKALRWIGLVGMEDPVRESAKDALTACRHAGIRVVMMTGDYAGTAKAVWLKLQSSEQAEKVRIMDGEELKKLTPQQMLKAVASTDIFARVLPEQKLKIVQLLKSQGEVVALLGDGVNDAPAVKEANIGIVVGDATDVAKETADMVLLDSNFKTVVDAIEEGRGIFDNIKKAILYLLSPSFAQVILVGISIVMQVPLPLTASQILWINLVTEGLPSLALTVEPKEKGLLKRRPIPQNAPLVDLEMRVLIICISGMIGVAGFLLFMQYLDTTSIEHARTVTFAFTSVMTLLIVFSVRSLSVPLVKINHLQNPLLLGAVAMGILFQISGIYLPFFHTFLHSVPLGFVEWMSILGAAMVVMGLIEFVKLIFLLRHPRGAGSRSNLSTAD